MKRLSSAFLFLLFTVTVSWWLAAQRAGQLPGTIRVKVTEVPVDVVVLDRDSRPVLNLQKEDFVILENGVPQDIAHFSLESYVSAERKGAVTSTPAEPKLAEPFFRNPNYRTFLIVIGQGRHRYFEAIPKLIEFVRNTLKPNDRVAFMAYNRASDFVSDHDSIVNLLERYEKISPSIESKVDLRKTGLAAIYGGPNILSQFQKEIDQIFQSDEPGSRRVSSTQIPGLKEQRAQDRELMQAKELLEMEETAAANQPNAPPPSAPGSPSTHLAERIQTELMLDGMEFDEYMELRTPANLDLERLSAAIEYLRYMEGEKHVIYLNEQGLALTRLEHDQGLAATASDARVRIHTIQTGGQFLSATNSPFNASRVGRIGVGGGMGGGGLGTSVQRPFPGTNVNAFALQSTANVARLTGGQSFFHRDLTGCLDTLEKTTSASYLLGYVPKYDAVDGSFRKIEVRVRRAGLRVLHRRGYYAERVLKPYDRKQFLTYSRTTVAAGLDELIHDVDFSLQAGIAARSGSPSVEASLTIRPAANAFVLKGDRYVGQLAISYFLFDESGRLLNETWDDLEMNLKPETHARVLKEGLPVNRAHELPPKTKRCLLRVVVYDPVTDRVGSAEAKLKAQ